MNEVKNCLAFGCNKPAAKMLKANVVATNELDCAIVETEVYACPGCATEEAAKLFMDDAGRMKNDIEKAFKAKEYDPPDWNKSSMFWADIPVRLILPDQEIKTSKFRKVTSIGKPSKGKRKAK